MKKHAAPIIAAFLLLLPLLYVGSYLTLVVPPQSVHVALIRINSDESDYRLGGRIAARFFWPLEQMDRRLRPKAWPGH